MAKYGYEEGDRCSRPTGIASCDGVIRLRAVENCSCHIAAPCSQCMASRHYCPSCEWEEANDTIINDFVTNVLPDGTFRCWEPRKLDPTKIDYHSKPHTHSTMLKTGVYPPESATREQVEAAVRGTFGGRFTYFHDGKFEYVAYTD